MSLLWNRTQTTKRGPRPRFTLDEIADAGIALADEQGLDAVTMHAVAERLGTTKMALYRYVPGRAELDAVMLDRALGQPPDPVAGDWQTSLAAWARLVYERYLARPWSVELVQRPHPPGPCELAWFEAGLHTLAGLPLTGGEKLDALALLSGQAISIVRQQAFASTPEHDLAAALAPVFAERSSSYPQTAAAFADAADGGREGALRFGVERIVAGLEALARDRSDPAGTPVS
ncbi:TetR/AcrR family transcriptional regulator [Microbacterium ulmi]|uniref:TetR/AcrR family transcriptional regulator n=2 Tax=Microbacterium ulmi TaxID=179095 RepID=A0A7Y2M191_9MICO|nr:TetR/AcrR family transcriptional regulator [Microbacterium ulmi]